ncbi:beta-mannosidase [Shimia ponticola]|uniref:beta-mannosidase n=1 Tax=Shimia ponticola TaxID=2582893 RepID=UPI0011BD6B59|nr:glycoside hydrolase family 2 protein [Shimia ponticola]
MINLAGEWSLQDETKSYACQMSLPGDIVSTLAKANLIPDPYWGQNEYDVRWIADRDWTVTREFQVTEKAQVLCLSQLDTVATVRVNDQAVLEAENAFRRYRVDVSDVLSVGVNQISITFHSPTRIANARQEAQPYFVPYTKNYPVPNGNMLRKPACDFGWDWNAALMPSGIYGDLHLEPVVPVRIADVLVHQDHEPGLAKVRVTALLEGMPEVAKATLCGQTASGAISGDRTTFDFEIHDPELWWPAGQRGDAPASVVHQLSIECDAAQTTRNVGLRTIELVSEPDEIGRSFLFRVNGREVFAKGANWIPQDALPGNSDPDALRDLLQSAVDANMNMIRVWGGGWYENDAFYDLCDELGIMVWQDAMFACSLYPADDAFLDEVTREVVDNARRLQHRASLALWCGDNELIGALTWYKESVEDRDRYLVAYDRLNRSIEMALKSVDPEVNWWPSSPSPGPLSFGDAWHDDSAGDMHFWSVWHEGRDFEHYRDVKPRFCSEFGFQSYPSMDVVRGFADPSDFNIAAPVMESHQKNAGGNARIAETMFRYFRFPTSFENFVYVSQVQQALAIQIAVTYWRSLRPHCMGTLIWQLNDTWPVCSWASLDYGGGWKLLHHMARRFYAPVLATIVPSDQGPVLHMVNDHPDDVETQVTVTAMTTHGATRVLFDGSMQLAENAASDPILLDPISDEELLHLRWTDADGTEWTECYAPRPFKAYNLSAPKIEMRVSHNEETTLTLRAEGLALFVAVEADIAGRFSDNAFPLLPGEERVITFTPQDVDRQARFLVRDLHSATF